MEFDNQGYQPEDPEVALGEALEHLQLTLSIEMRRLRKREGLTQGELGERMGVNQSTVSKLENANVHSDLESLLKYLFALDADLVLSILDGNELIPVSEAAEDWCAAQDQATRRQEKAASSERPSWQLPSSATDRELTLKTKVIPFDDATKLLESRNQRKKTRWSANTESQREHGSAHFETDEPIAG